MRVPDGARHTDGQPETDQRDSGAAMPAAVPGAELQLQTDCYRPKRRGLHRLPSLQQRSSPSLDRREAVARQQPILTVQGLQRRDHRLCCAVAPRRCQPERHLSDRVVLSPFVGQRWAPLPRPGCPIDLRSSAPQRVTFRAGPLQPRAAAGQGRQAHDLGPVVGKRGGIAKPMNSNGHLASHAVHRFPAPLTTASPHAASLRE